MREFKEFVYKLVILGVLLIVAFLFSSCNCNRTKDSKNGTDSDDADDSDDTDDDNTDDDDIAEGWHVYTIDSEEYSGKYTSLAVDLYNKAHIGYYGYLYEKGYQGVLKYATNKSGAWEILVIDEVAWLHENNSIKANSSGKAHISYGKDGKLWYTTNKSGSWQTLVVDSLVNGVTGEYPSIVLDSSEKVHISYFQCGKADETGCLVPMVKYATNKSGTWQTFQIASTYTPYGSYTSIAVDSNDKVHITYSKAADGDDGGLIYVNNISGNWTSYVIDNWGGPFGEIPSSIAIDSSDKVHIAYGDLDRRIVYATNASGSWQVEGVDGSASDPSIAFDSQNKVHTSYRKEPSEDKHVLMYATNKSGSWDKTIVDFSGDAGWYSSIAVDSDDYVHISYYDAENKHLKYATNRPPDRSRH